MPNLRETLQDFYLNADSMHGQNIAAVLSLIEESRDKQNGLLAGADKGGLLQVKLQLRDNQLLTPEQREGLTKRINDLVGI